MARLAKSGRRHFQRRHFEKAPTLGGIFSHSVAIPQEQSTPLWQSPHLCQISTGLYQQSNAEQGIQQAIKAAKRTLVELTRDYQCAKQEFDRSKNTSSVAQCLGRVNQAEQPPLKFEIIGAGLAGLCMAVQISKSFPECSILIKESRPEELAAIRFQNLSFRIPLCERLFEGTGLLGTADNPGLLEQCGAWRNEDHNNPIQSRVRAPIGVFQHAISKYLKQLPTVTFQYNQSVDISSDLSKDPNTMTFMSTGMNGLHTIREKYPQLKPQLKITNWPIPVLKST